LRLSLRGRPFNGHLGSVNHVGEWLWRGQATEVESSTRNLPTYRDASIILINQLKEIFIDADHAFVETANRS
jgi:hypothetical protein